MGKSESSKEKTAGFDGELYDRRLKVYLAAHELLSQVSRDGRVSGPSLHAFEEEKLKGEFLFSEKVSSYLDELKSLAGKNLASNTVLEHMGEDEEEQKAKFTKDADKSLEWLVKQREKLKGTFARDMAGN